MVGRLPGLSTKLNKINWQGRTCKNRRTKYTQANECPNRYT